MQAAPGDRSDPGAAPPAGRVRTAWLRIGDPAALSWRVIFLMLPAVIFSPVLADHALYGGPWSAWIVVAGIAEVVLIAILVGARPLLARVGTGGARSAFVLATFVTAGVVRGAAIGTTEAVLGIAPDFEVLFRLVIGPPFIIALLLLAATAVVLHDEHQAIVARLEAERARLLALRRSVDFLLERARRELVARVHETIDPGLRELDAALGPDGGASAGSVVPALRTFIEREVRGFSHRIVADAEPGESGVPIDPVRARPQVPIPPRLPLASGLRPAFLAVLYLVISAPSGLRTLPAPEAIAWSVGVALTAGGLLWLTRRIAGRVELPTPLQLAAVVVVHAIIGVLVIPILRTIGLAVPPNVTAAAIATSAFVGVVAAIAGAVGARRTATEADLRETVLALAETVADLRRRTWLTRRRIATVLHGTIQGTLHVAAIRIASAGTVDAELAATIRREIAAALETLTTTSDAVPDLAAALDDITALWDGTCAIDTRVDGEVGPALAPRTDARAAVIEVVREAVGNAVRHGGASAVTIAISMAGSAVEARVDDDGRGWQGERGGGMGSRLFDELCDAWSHERRDGGTTLRARIALT